MSRYYYVKTRKRTSLHWFRLASGAFLLAGIILVLYIFSPLIVWQLSFTPLFASQLASPIPQATRLSSLTLGNILSTAANAVGLVDYEDAKNWFPGATVGQQQANAVATYHLSIPKIGIRNAIVATTDYALALHLVNYIGTPVPGEKGNAVVFGHSTLPQLFNPNDYKTVFANLYKLRVGDEVEANVSGVVYRYRIATITVVDPSDTSIFSQKYDHSYLTLVTCTPPGTVWQRLIVNARLQTL